MSCYDLLSTHAHTHTLHPLPFTVSVLCTRELCSWMMSHKYTWSCNFGLHMSLYVQLLGLNCRSQGVSVGKGNKVHEPFKPIKVFLECLMEERWRVHPVCCTWISDTTFGVWMRGELATLSLSDSMCALWGWIWDLELIVHVYCSSYCEQQHFLSVPDKENIMEEIRLPGEGLQI